MSAECELDKGIKSIKDAWQREHTARANLEKMLEQAEADNAKLRELVRDMWFWHYEGHIDSESQERQMLHIDAVIQRMRELGAEVDG